MTFAKTLVIQPRSGIGDMIWHLPYIRTLVREVAGNPVHLLTKSKTQAQAWLYNEPSIAQIDYLDRRQLLTTGLKLRRHSFEQAWILHTSTSYALVSCLAGIPKRIGLSKKNHSLLLTQSPLTIEERAGNHLQQLQALFKHYNLVSKPEDQLITLDPVAIQFVKNRFKQLTQPWICFGIGATETYRTWPADYFIGLAQGLDQYFRVQNYAQCSHYTFFICGSKAESATVQCITQSLQQQSISAVAVDDLTLTQMFALLSLSSLFIGNDSGLLNASACVGTPSVGLFGSSPPLTYSANIYPAIPRCPTYGHKNGMLSLTSEYVMNFIKRNRLIEFTAHDLKNR